MSIYDRRHFLLRSGGLLSTVMLAGCDQLSQNAWFRPALGRSEGLTERLQRFLMRSGSLAREYSEADLSPVFRANGSTADQWRGEQACHLWHAAREHIRRRPLLGGKPRQWPK
jgi:hypothetical protein